MGVGVGVGVVIRNHVKLKSVISEKERIISNG